ncbi:MAG: amidase family protein, partial [Alphaproteobacteria bacterium]
QTLVLNNLDSNVASAFETAVENLSLAGAKITDIPFKPLDDIPRINANGGIYAEAWAVHKEHFNESRHFYDPRVAARIEKTQNITSEEYEAVLRAREILIAEANRITNNFDALILPTTPSSAPKIIDLENDSEAYIEMNVRMLRNCFCFNFLDRCALSIPIHAPGSAPCGLMIVGETMGDRELLGIGQAIEKVVKLS